MTSGLATVPTATLERVRDLLQTDRLTVPLRAADLAMHGVGAHVVDLAKCFGSHERSACLAMVEVIIAERRALYRPEPELVWTGPEAAGSRSRDTAVVLRELFQSARRRVVLAGYSFHDADRVLAPLHGAMAEHGVDAHLFVDVRQAEGPLDDPEEYGREALRTFRRTCWSFGAPWPTLYCDRRALVPGPPWSSLHAKCVSVDGKRAFVSSANFTARGQDRNIEVGVLLSDERLARRLESQWMALAMSGRVVRLA